MRSTQARNGAFTNNQQLCTRSKTWNFGNMKLNWTQRLLPQQHGQISKTYNGEGKKQAARHELNSHSH